MRPFFVLILIAGCGGESTPPRELQTDDSADLAESAPDLAKSKPDMARPACVAKSCDSLGLACGSSVDNCGDPIDCGGCNADSICTTDHQCLPHCADGIKNADES